MATIRTIGFAHQITTAPDDGNYTWMNCYLLLSAPVPATRFHAEFDQHPELIKFDGISSLVAERADEVDGRRHLISFKVLKGPNSGVFIGYLTVSLLTSERQPIASASVDIAVVR